MKNTGELVGLRADRRVRWPLRFALDRALARSGRRWSFWSVWHACFNGLLHEEIDHVVVPAVEAAWLVERSAVRVQRGRGVDLRERQNTVGKRRRPRVVRRAR